MLPKLTLLLNLFSVVMVVLTVGYLLMAFPEVFAPWLKALLFSGASTYGFGHCLVAASVRQQKNNEQV